MRSPFLRNAAIMLALVTLGGLVGCAQHRPLYVGPTPSAASPWKIVQVIGPWDGDTMMVDIAATGPQDAWAIAQAFCGRRCGPRMISLAVEHWDGSRWLPIPALPRRARHAENAFVGASSGSDAWVFAEFDRGADAVHWDGKRWSVFSAPNCGQVFPVVFGPHDAWAFSGGSHACGSHFNGHEWRKIAMPGIPDAVSAVSRNDIWVTGRVPSGRREPGSHDTRKPRYIAMHWNGRSWAAIGFPDLNLGSEQWLTGGNIVATGPRDAWIDYGIQHRGSNATTGHLLHWDGDSWHLITIPLAPYGVGSMARDGRGGLWLTAEGSSPTGVNWYFYHLSRGKLKLVAAPARRGATQLFGAGQLAWIPGTTSLWAIQTVSSGRNGGQGEILRYSG